MSRRPAADLSPEAVALRLADLGDLWDFAASLATARILGPVSDAPLRAADAGAQDAPAAGSRAVQPWPGKRTQGAERRRVRKGGGKRRR